MYSALLLTEFGLWKHGFTIRPLNPTRRFSLGDVGAALRRRGKTLPWATVPMPRRARWTQEARPTWAGLTRQCLAAGATLSGRFLRLRSVQAPMPITQISFPP